MPLLLLLSLSFFVSNVLSQGTIVNRTYGIHKNLYI